MNDEDDYETKSNRIQDLASSPVDNLTDHLSQLHNTLDSSVPNIAPHVYSTANAAIQFLNSKIPQPGSNMIGEEIQPVSPYQKKQWLDLHSVIDDPIKLLDHADQGTLTKDHVEAVQNVYPEIYNEISNQVLMNLSQSKQKGVIIPFKKKLMIAKLLGQPIDSSMDLPSLTSISTANSNVKSQENISNETAVKSSNVKLLSDNDKMTATNIQSRGIKKLTGK